MVNKSNGTKLKITIAILIAGFAITVAGIVWDASNKSSGIEANRKDIDVIIPKVDTNKEACLEFRYKIDRLDEKMVELNAAQKSMQREQKTAFNEILNRLPE